MLVFLQPFFFYESQRRGSQYKQERTTISRVETLTSSMRSDLQVTFNRRADPRWAAAQAGTDFHAVHQFSLMNFIIADELIHRFFSLLEAACVLMHLKSIYPSYHARFTPTGNVGEVKQRKKDHQKSQKKRNFESGFNGILWPQI